MSSMRFRLALPCATLLLLGGCAAVPVVQLAAQAMSAPAVVPSAGAMPDGRVMSNGTGAVSSTGAMSNGAGAMASAGAVSNGTGAMSNGTGATAIDVTQAPLTSGMAQVAHGLQGMLQRMTAPQSGP